jgi:hypothetical protein
MHVLDGLLDVAIGLGALVLAGWLFTVDPTVTVTTDDVDLDVQARVERSYRAWLLAVRLIGWLVFWSTIYGLTMGVVQVAASR